MVHVVAENTSAAYHEEDNSIRTDNIPRYYQMRLKTKDALTQYVTFEKLIQDPVGNLTVIYEEMNRIMRSVSTSSIIQGSKRSMQKNGLKMH